MNPYQRLYDFLEENDGYFILESGETTHATLILPDRQIHALQLTPSEAIEACLKASLCG